MTRRVSVAEAKESFSEWVRRAELNGEAVIVSNRDEPLAAIEAAEDDWRDRLFGLLADAPEVCEEIDRIYAERRLHMPRQVEL